MGLNEVKAVFDTNILIDYLNGEPAAEREISSYDVRMISMITRIKVLVGADPGEEPVVKGFLSTFQSMAVDQDIADIATNLRRECKLKVPDAIVYATAKKEGCPLISRNSKDFKEEWPDVRVPYRL